MVPDHNKKRGVMKFMYQAEKLSAAMRSLMLPHPQGEAESIMHAFHNCSLGFHDLHDKDLDDNARSWVATIKELMDTTGIDDPMGRGTWLIKAERLTEDQRCELSNAVDELAHWFDRKFWGNE